MIIASNRFNQKLQEFDVPLTRSTPSILQLNVGKLCNLTCIHCHVNAGPSRKEIITKETIDQILHWLAENPSLRTVDLTGGTPEMIPDFQYLVKRLKEMNIHVMDRLNATIIEEAEYGWIPEFHAQHGIEIIASMPCYSPENVDEQRGDGVFEKSISAFQKLNEIGYGKEGSGLILNFVYNPNGAFLPGDQAELEADYKREMKKHFNIEFNQLFALANLPVSRFASYLKKNKKLDEYYDLLLQNFNPNTVEGLMCRDTINVSWKGEVFDCDFNQMKKMNHHTETGDDLFVWDIDLKEFANRPIKTDDHCLGCTAGAGSSCGGSLA